MEKCVVSIVPSSNFGGVQSTNIAAESSSINL